MTAAPATLVANAASTDVRARTVRMGLLLFSGDCALLGIDAV
jgi:hypothetical protein